MNNLFRLLVDYLEPLHAPLDRQNPKRMKTFNYKDLIEEMKSARNKWWIKNGRLVAPLRHTAVH